ncbi:MAG: pyruvate carboxylase [Pseudomonas sp.]|nr:pyruvate carboxylase [Pseudomonas sp.]
MCQLKAVENGADHIDTAISSFAWGTSHPGTESMVAALKGSEFDTGLDLELLQEIGLYFYAVRKKYHQFESEFTAVDTRVQVNQVPGGMISNLANQLKEQGALNRMNEVLAEIPRVREDLGFPPLVTPTSQIVGTQAFFNVLAGERYKTITNEVKLYLQGGYGKAPGTINERNDIGALARCEEDVLTFAMFPDIGRKFLEEREAGTLVPEALLPIPEAGAVAAPSGEGVPTEFVIDVHGETYRVDITGVGVKAEGKRHFYLTIDGMPEEVVFEPLNEFVGGGGSKRKQASGPGHVSTTMPGNIVDVLVKEGDAVKAGQAVLITEAMKMETEVQATIAGKVTAIHVAKGDRVTPGEILIEIEG